MYDKYDSPHGEEPQDYGPSAQDQIGEQAGPIIDAVRGKWKIIVAAIVLAIVAYAAYDFFVGSYREVSVQAFDTEGKAISASIKISNAQGQAAASLSPGQKAKLKAGEYTMSAAASGYRPISDYPLTVSANSSEKLELESDKAITLTGTFPAKLISGERKEIELTLTNGGGSSEKAELLLEGDAAKDAKLEYGSPLDVPPGESAILATLVALDKASGAKAGTGKSGSIRIKGLREGAQISGKYELIQFDASKLDIRIDGDASNADFGQLAPAEHNAKKKITFENRNDFDVENLTVKKEIQSPGFDTDYDIAEWISLNPKGGIDVKAGERSKQVQIDLAVPRDVAFPEGAQSVKVSGTITISNTYFSKEFTFTFEVKKPEIKLDADIPITITIRKGATGWEKIDNPMKIINRGRVTLTDIRAAVKCSNAIGEPWLTLFDSEANGYKSTVTIDQLPSSSEPRVVNYHVEVPSATKPGETSICSLRLRYDDPNGPSQTVEKIVTVKAQA